MSNGVEIEERKMEIAFSEYKPLEHYHRRLKLSKRKMKGLLDELCPQCGLIFNMIGNEVVSILPIENVESLDWLTNDAMDVLMKMAIEHCRRDTSGKTEEGKYA
jgi:hypothetical protein